MTPNNTKNTQPKNELEKKTEWTKKNREKRGVFEGKKEVFLKGKKTLNRKLCCGVALTMVATFEILDTVNTSSMILGICAFSIIGRLDVVDVVDVVVVLDTG